MVNWFDNRNILIRLALMAAFGAVAALGQAPFDLPWVFVLALVPVFALQAQGGSGRAAFGRGWAFAAGYFGLSLEWIMQPFEVEPEIYGWMAPFALILMAGGLGLLWGAAFALARWLARHGAAAMTALVCVWSIEEMFRSYAFTGFPWVLPGHVWINAPQVQWAAFIGPHGLTLVTLALAMGLTLALQPGVPALARIASVLPVAGFALSGPLLDPGPAVPDPARPLVRIVQPNAPQAEKFDPDRIPIFQSRLMRATAADPKPALVVWPETAVPYLLEWSDDILATASDLARGAPVVIGLNRRDGDRLYNSLVVTGNSGQVTAVYDKVHLVPFGEYIPLGELFPRLGLHGIAASEGGGFSAGSPRPLIDFPGLGRGRALICYEGSFADEIIGADGARPDFLLLITNDAWFGTFAGPYQHLAHARLRAVEQGLPVIRAANTGVSALIDGKGRILGSLPLGQSGHLDLPLPGPLGPTLYARLGDWPAFLAALMGIGAILRRKRRIKIDLAPSGQ